MARRQLPQAIDEEKAVLGCCLLDWQSGLPKAMARLSPVDFYRPAHRKIFEAMALLMQKQKAIDYLTLSDQLEAMGCLDEVGGAYYLTELTNAIPSSARVGYYADIVKQKSNLRRLIIIGKEMAESAFDSDGSPIEIANAATSKLFNLDTATARESFQRIDALLMKTIEHKECGRLSGIPTGMEEMDRKVKIQPTDLVILAGRPSSGKSVMMMEMSRGFAVRGTPNAVFSLEMSDTSLGLRILSEYSSEASKRISEVTDLEIWVDDTPAQLIDTIIGKMFEMKHDRGLGAFFIDYLQLVKSPDKGKKENRNLELTDITQKLKAANKLMRVPIIALSQLSRDLEKRQNKRPVPSDLRESGAIEQDADIILFLYRHGMYHKSFDPRVTEVIIGKQRNGPTGKFEMMFDMPKSRFRPCETNGRPTAPLPGYEVIKDGYDRDDGPGF